MIDKKTVNIYCILKQIDNAGTKPIATTLINWYLRM